MRRALLVAFVAVLELALPSGSQAYPVALDRYSITRNGSLFFDDPFADGVAPPSGPAGASTYGVFGTLPAGAESGGTLTLDYRYGLPTTNALGSAREALLITRLSNIDPANPDFGFRLGDTLDFTGAFDLVAPPGPLINGYGLQVMDTPFGQPVDRSVELDVQYNSNLGGNVIRYLQQDFTLGTLTTLGFVPLAPPPGADQVALSIVRPDIANNEFFGAYAFGTAGTFGPVTTFAAPGELFTQSDFVRGRVLAFTAVAAVPEPVTGALVGLALLALGWTRRRQR